MGEHKLLRKIFHNEIAAEGGTKKSRPSYWYHCKTCNFSIGCWDKEEYKKEKRQHKQGTCAMEPAPHPNGGWVLAREDIAEWYREASKQNEEHK